MGKKKKTGGGGGHEFCRAGECAILMRRASIATSEIESAYIIITRSTSCRDTQTPTSLTISARLCLRTRELG